MRRTETTKRPVSRNVRARSRFAPGRGRSVPSEAVSLASGHTRRGQQHPERVRQEVRATGPADLHAVVQFFNSVLSGEGLARYLKECSARFQSLPVRTAREVFHQAAFDQAVEWNESNYPLAVTYHDPDHSLSEERFITVGTSRNGRVLIVAHSDRGENIRIISARNTTLRERKHYEEEN
jgi:uncharacterized protein